MSRYIISSFPDDPIVPIGLSRITAPTTGTNRTGVVVLLVPVVVALILLK
jgi:hypothetical protein